ncbi:MAG TPA: nucleotide exchange factor GrpE [Bacillota bacterium]|nr:MAG: heat shock protein GrpE [Synergistetes bacterium ADurb.BinA166]HNZ09544.1 nucleotide exchange factor GrpE [Bacillota bacterium]HOH10827.1 nucleotide exchange factor GrpE [Bacillota bacterium]HOY88975.1 nucleotide exchange factor GrpE [Bacillota bacterium]HPI01231.1 nucleotide exchange factor GrpE [Bacillota bacterium]
MKDRQIKEDPAQKPAEISPEEAARILAELTRELEAAKKSTEEYKNSYLRARADYENFRKRSERDHDEKIRRGKADFMLKVLEVMDDLDRAVAADAGYDALRQGLDMTTKKMGVMLKGEGIEPIEAVGCAFDPALHEAVTASEGDVEHETIEQELRKGYTYCGSTLRPSIVRVTVPRKS